MVEQFFRRTAERRQCVLSLLGQNNRRGMKITPSFHFTVQ